MKYSFLLYLNPLDVLLLLDNQLNYMLSNPQVYGIKMNLLNQEDFVKVEELSFVNHGLILYCFGIILSLNLMM